MGLERALIKRYPRELCHSFCHIRTEQQKAVCEPESISSSALNLDFPVSRTVRNICCLNSPVSGIFAIVNQKDSDTTHVWYRWSNCKTCVPNTSVWKWRGSGNHSVVSNSLRPHGLYNPWNSPGQDTGVGSQSLLQAIFSTQGLNPGLPHCRQILY